MQCETADLIVAEDWQAIRAHPRGWKMYSDEEMFFIVAFSQYRELLRNYPASILFIGQGTDSRVAEILHDLPERGLVSCQFDEVDTPEVLRRITAYHNWVDGSGRPISYRQSRNGLAVPHETDVEALQMLLGIQDPGIVISAEPPETRIILCADRQFALQVIVPFLKTQLGYQFVRVHQIR